MNTALLAKIHAKEAQIGVIGLGYVGLPLVVAFLDAGYRVLGFDTDPHKVEDLCKGRSDIADVPTERLVASLPNGRLRLTTAEAPLAEADCVFLCVPTPLTTHHDPDMRHIAQAVATLQRHPRPGRLVVLESTSYPGTTRDYVAARLSEYGASGVGEDLVVAFSPERVDPGNKLFHTHNTPRVVGGMTPTCLALAVALYAQIVDRVVPLSSPEAAEMVKLLENTFRAVNIGLVNEFAKICNRLSLDVWEIIEAAATKPFGYMPFFPGPGLGGHCIPIDPLYLSWKVRSLNMSAQFVELADQINRSMPEYVVGLIGKALNHHKKAFHGANILVCGVAYKRDVSDVRESPALHVLQLLSSRKASLFYLDPWVSTLPESCGVSIPRVGPDTNFSGYDCVVILTDHSQVDYARMCKEARCVVDTRNATKPFASVTKAHLVRL